MCYHNSLKKNAVDISEYYDAPFEESELFEPLFHISGFELRDFPIVTNIYNFKQLKMATWGLEFPWMLNNKDYKKIKFQHLNARAETIFEKKSYKEVIIQHRCLIPSTGFFEWREFNKKKYPYFIHLKNRELFSFAGIYNIILLNDTQQTLFSFSMVTTEANDLMKKIHNTKHRMPLILHRKDEKKWIDNTLNKSEISQLLIPYPAHKMDAFTIEKTISSFKNTTTNIPEIATPFQYPELKIVQNTLF